MDLESNDQQDLLSEVSDADLVRWLLADLHDGLQGKVARFRQLTDLSSVLGSSGTMLPGGETTWHAWNEARTSYIHGNYVAVVMLCQGLAEHVLAGHFSLRPGTLPPRISFRETLDRCGESGVLGESDICDLIRLMDIRNPLSHFRDINDPANLSRRVMETSISAESHLFADATFAIGVAVRLLALPAFRLGK